MQPLPRLLSRSKSERAFVFYDTFCLYRAIRLRAIADPVNGHVRFLFGLGYLVDCGSNRQRRTLPPWQVDAESGSIAKRNENTTPFFDKKNQTPNGI